LQTVHKFQQCLLLLFHLAKLFSNGGVLGLHSHYFVLQVVRPAFLSNDFLLRIA